MQDPAAFNRELRQSTVLADCAGLFRDAIAPLGFDTFACGELDMEDRDRRVFYIIDWPPSWQSFYMRSGLINRDPLIDALATRRLPFTWSDLRADRKLPGIGREALDLAAAAGWSEGVVIPLPSSGSRVGLVSMVGHQPIHDSGVLDYLYLIGASLHSHVRSLAPREGFAIPPMGLTDREQVCLRFVARGHSDTVIAEALGIAPSTAHEFVEKAKRRLKARTRVEMIATAAAFGIIDI